MVEGRGQGLRVVVEGICKDSKGIDLQEWYRGQMERKGIDLREWYRRQIDGKGRCRTYNSPEPSATVKATPHKFVQSRVV